MAASSTSCFSAISFARARRQSRARVSPAHAASCPMRDAQIATQSSSFAT
jgi:hypothetical protein